LPIQKEYDKLLDDVLQGYTEHEFDITPDNSIQSILDDYGNLNKLLKSRVGFNFKKGTSILQFQRYTPSLSTIIIYI